MKDTYAKGYLQAIPTKFVKKYFKCTVIYRGLFKLWATRVYKWAIIIITKLRINITFMIAAPLTENSFFVLSLHFFSDKSWKGISPLFQHEDRRLTKKLLKLISGKYCYKLQVQLEKINLKLNSLYIKINQVRL